jgi:hypothetical protein
MEAGFGGGETGEILEASKARFDRGERGQPAKGEPIESLKAGFDTGEGGCLPRVNLYNPGLIGAR